MATRYLVLSLLYFKVANSQYYSAPAPSYRSYNYNYYSPTPISAPPSFGPTSLNIPPTTPKQPKILKRNIATLPCPKCSPSTASTYFLSTPAEKVKSSVLTNDKKEKSILPPPTYFCPLCNNFEDVPLNPKILPPPPVGAPVLPGILDEIPTIVIPKDLTLTDPISILSQRKTPMFSDMYEKHKFPNNLSFDQELLEGFLTGLGITING